jgi:hypothetical protein
MLPVQTQHEGSIRCPRGFMSSSSCLLLQAGAMSTLTTRPHLCASRTPVHQRLPAAQFLSVRTFHLCVHMTFAGAIRFYWTCIFPFL